MTITTIAGIAGRILGTAAKGLIWANDHIDWAEVAAIVLHGLQVLIVLALLAGRGARRLWDGLPGFSERIGKAYAALLVGAVETVQIAAAIHPLATLAAELEQLTRAELQAMAGTRRKLSKRQLVALMLAS
jgi:hypothetical protein